MLQGLRKEHIEAGMQQAYAVTVISNELVRCLRTEARLFPGEEQLAARWPWGVTAVMGLVSLGGSE